MRDDDHQNNTGAEYKTTADELRAEAERMLDAGVVPVRLDPKSRSWSPLNPGSRPAKAPLIRSAEDAARLLRAGDNLGHWLEGGLTQIDADWPEAGETALAQFPGLPHWGRASKAVSGFFVRSPGLASYDFKLPEACNGDQRFAGEHGLMILQLRSAEGTNTMGPPSCHPNGERIAWAAEPNGEIPELDAPSVRRATGLAALLAVVQRCYPGEGKRNHLQLHLSGALCHNGYSAAEADEANRWIAERNADQEAKSRLQAKKTEAKQRAGKKTTGLPKLVELLGLPKECIATFKQWLSPQDAEGDNDDGRPTIHVRAGRWHDAATQAEAALLEANAPIYTWAGRLVRPIREAAGAAMLRRLTQANALDWLSRHIVWQQTRGDKLVEINPPKDVAAILLDRAGDWSFPAISGVINCPTMRPDGSLLTEAGYDAATRLYLVDPPRLPAIPDAPTREDAGAALGLLDDLLTEFPFVTEEGHSAALSLFMTPILRGAMDVAPMHVVRATTARTGKTLLTNLAALIATGRTAPVLSLACRTEEQEKRLGGALLSGQPVISIDNHNGELSGDLLAQAIEQALVLVRPLGTSDTVRIENRFCFLANGNGITLRDDLVGRSLLAHLDAQSETPQLREFTGNPAEAIREDRGRYIAAVLTIARAYIAAGCPDQLSPPASFADWSQLVRSALVWLGRADPLITQEALQDEEPVRDVLRDVIQAWAQARARRPGLFQRPLLVRELLAHALDDELLSMALRDATRQKGDADELNAVKIGQWLKRHEGRIVDGCRLMSRMGRTNQKAWWLDGEPPAPEHAEEQHADGGNVIQISARAKGASGMFPPRY